MSERLDKFCHSLQTNLNDLEARMTSLKTKLQSAPRQAEEAVHKQLDQLQQKVNSQKQAVAKAKTSVLNWIEQKKAEAKGTIDEWTKKLVHRADRAEEYAAAAIVVAAATLDEAEQAVLEAVSARREADAIEN
jgi:tellurite resistance protein